MAAAGKCGVDRNERQRKQRWQEAAATQPRPLWERCVMWKDRSQFLKIGELSGQGREPRAWIWFSAPQHAALLRIELRLRDARTGF